ncbi:MAG TPA: VOC family protein [Vicinamibacterales bacterium]|nr:VOC family protein [Vicinamibacterales bacterium]
MTRIVRILLLACLVAVPSRAFAQLADGPVVYGHHHLNVSNIDQAKKFWADTLGGTVVHVGTDHREAVSIPGLWIFFFMKAPTAGSKGSTEDHIGLSVPDLDAAIAKVKANGFRVVTAQEAPPSYKVTGDVASPAPNTRLAFIMGPDDAKVELVEAKAQTVPVRLNHIHFAGDENLAMRDWYVKTFGATAAPSAPNPPFYGATLPGVRLNFSPAAAKPAGTDGRAYDHIGFEVKDLAAFLQKLEAEGIKPAQPMRHNDVLNINLAFITDPWGTKIELTQGLRDLH